MSQALKKVAIIGTVGLPAKYGGWETLVEYLVRYLSRRFDMTVFCSAHNYQERPSEYQGVRLEYLSLKANGVQSIFYDAFSMAKSLRADTMLILGVSGCVFLPLVRLFSRSRIVVNIDGLEWKRDKWGAAAKRFLKLSEKIAVNYADLVVTDNKVLQDYVKAEYGHDSALIAYGGDQAQKIAVSQDTLKRYPFLERPYAMTVCRIEPENNIHVIIEAFAQEGVSIPLVIVGNWDVSQYGKDLRVKYANTAHIHLLDPIYEQNLLNQIRSNCSVYLHGHSAGGTNPSLVEAMNLKLPVFAYDVSFNRETTEHKARYFRSASELRALIASTASSELDQIASELGEVAKRRYTWEKIAEEYASTL